MRFALKRSVGKETPLAGLAFRLPVWNRFRIPTRHLMEFTLAVAVLAGFGVAELQRLPAADRRRLVRNALALLAGLVLLALVWFAGMVASGLYTRHMPAPRRPHARRRAPPRRVQAQESDAPVPQP